MKSSINVNVHVFRVGLPILLKFKINLSFVIIFNLQNYESNLEPNERVNSFTTYIRLTHDILTLTYSKNHFSGSYNCGTHKKTLYKTGERVKMNILPLKIMVSWKCFYRAWNAHMHGIGLIWIDSRKKQQIFFRALL